MSENRKLCSEGRSYLRAARVLGQVREGSSLSKVLANYSSGVDPVALCCIYGVLRWRNRYDFFQGELLARPLAHQVLSELLCVGLHCLESMDRPSHAVINTMVDAAYQFGKKYAGLVNGVLRNFLRNKVALNAKITPSQAALFWSYPQWWIQQVRRDHPKHWQEILDAGNAHPPMALRINQRRSSVDEYLVCLDQLERPCRFLAHEAVLLTQPCSAKLLPGFESGQVSVQDFGAQWAAHFLDLSNGMHVLDACAAPGGKSLHLLELFDLNLTAIDLEAARLSRLYVEIKRLGVKRCKTKAVDLREFQSSAHFDRILLDVPCSGSGSVRRHLDAKWLRRADDMVQYMVLQRQLLQSAWKLLRPGGKLLYVTCSVFSQENQQQIKRFLQGRKNAQQVALEKPQGFAELQGVSLDGSLQLFPSACHDGFFYTLLQKAPVGKQT